MQATRISATLSREPMKAEFRLVDGLEPGAFNGSVLKTTNGLLCVYRNLRNGLSASWIDDSYRALTSFDLGLHGNQDPRLFRWPPLSEAQESLFMTTCYVGPVRQEVWPVDTSLPNLVRSSFHFWFDDIEGMQKTGHWEKNWQPFSCGKDLFFEYSIGGGSGHLRDRHILRFDPSRNRVRLEVTLPGSSHLTSQNAEAFLSVPSVDLGHERLGMMHWKDKDRAYYHAFYTFSAKPPFELLRVSKEPIWGSSETPELPLGDVGLRLYYPLSMEQDGDYVRISGGINGSAVFVATLLLKDILDSLRPI